MKFLFKRKKPVARKAQQSDHIGIKVARFINQYQLKAARWMQLKSEKLSLKSKWVLLFLFCISVFSASVLLIAGKFISNKSRPTITITKIKTPVKLEPLTGSKAGISKAEYERIIAFKIYMDSLARSPGGTRELDQINKAHPGLLDSIKTIEKIYQSQFKN